MWVGVTAQTLGHRRRYEHAGRLAGAADTRDPVRYGSLEHPGDAFSYDIYSQAGQAVRADAASRARGPDAAARDRGRRVAVRVLPHHYVNAIAPIGEGLRRFPVPRPRRCRRPARRHPASSAPEGTDAHPSRPRRPGAHLHDRDRTSSPRLRPGAATRHRVSPHVGGRGTSHYDTYGLVDRAQGSAATARSTPRSSTR